MTGAPATARIENLVTHGTFGGPHGIPLDNNAWIVGDEHEVIVIDPAHDARAVADAVGGRRVRAILLTHGHDDHIGAAPAFAAIVGAPLYLGADDGTLWEMSHPSTEHPAALADGDEFAVAGVTLRAIHTPGHTPGSTCLYVPALQTVFTGDTLFEGGPGATGGRPFSSFETIIRSIRERLLTLPSGTVVNTGHGPSTTIGAEAPHLDEWIARGY